MKLVTIGELLARRKDPVIIQDNKKYKRVTIRIKHQGISMRDEEMGEKIGTKKQFLVREGQFLMSKIDARNGAFGIVPEDLDDAIITGNFWAYDVNDELLDINWFTIFTSSPDFIEICKDASSGTTNRKYLDEGKFLGQEVRLPDIPEQQEIVERYNSSKYLQDKLQIENSFQSQLIERLKLSILMDAVQGKLVEQDPNDEPASVLLEKIQHEKERLVNQKIIRKQKELPPVTEDAKFFELPEGWEWVRLGNIILSAEAGKSHKCHSRSVEENEWGIVKTSAITSGAFVESENKFYATERPESTSNKIESGDLIFCRASGTKGLAGTSCYVSKIESNLLLSDKTIRVRTVDPTLSKYIDIYNKSPFAKLYYGTLTTGKSTSMNNITRPQLLAMPIALPPLQNQKRILESLEVYVEKSSQLVLENKKRKIIEERFKEVFLHEALSHSG